VELDEALEELVGLIARRGPRALERTKRLVNDGLAAGLERGLELEKEIAAEHMVGQEAKAGLERFHARKARS
jgi:enoyl-CoA hydratase/carnithine racemase